MKYEQYKMEDVLEALIDYRGKTPKKSESGIMTLSAKSVRDGFIDYSQCYCISEEEYNRFMVRGFPKKGDVLLTTEAPLGITARLDRDDIAIAQRLLTLRGKEGVLDTGYLYYYLKSHEGQAKLKEKESGTTVTGIKQSEFRKIQICLPSFLLQKKIVSILEMIDNKISVNKQINDNLLQQAEAIYKAWFCDHSGKNESSSWPITTIGDITSLVVRGITPKYNEGTDQIVINQKCIRNHTLDLTPSRRHLPKAITEKWLRQGDLLINSTGEGTLGRVAQVWFIPNNLTVDSHVTIVRPKNAVLCNYIGLWGLTHETEIESLHTGSTGQTELPRERVKAMELPLPDDSILSRFNEIITPMTQTIVKNQQENTRLAELRDILLPRLMSGELDVSELNL